MDTGGLTSKNLEKLHTGEVWRRIREEFLATGQAAAVHASLTATLDRMAVEAFESTVGARFPQGVAMLAVGGFGRSELFPYSDVDIMILLESEPLLPAIKDSLSEFIRLLW